MPRILTVDLGESIVKAALLEGSLRAPRVLVLASRPVVPQSDPAEALKWLLREEIGAFDSALSAISGDSVSHRFIEFPFSDRSRLEQTVPFELEAHTPFDLDGHLVSFTQVQQHGQGGSLVLAALSSTDSVRSHLETLARADVDPTAVDLAGIAVANLLLHLTRGQNGDQALADLSGERLLLALVRQGTLAGIRLLRVERQDLQRTARDLHWSLLALGHGKCPELTQLWLGGCGAATDEAAREFSNRLAVPVRSLNEAQIPIVPARLRGRQADCVVPLGLALRQDPQSRGLALNFRQQELAYHGKQEELWRRVTRVGILSAVALLLLVTACVVEAHRRQEHLTELKAEIRQLFRRTLPSVKRVVNEKAQLEAALAELEEKRRLFGSVLSSVPRSIDLLRALAASVPSNSRMAVEELTIDGGLVKLAATVPSFEAVDAVKSAFASVPLFTNVTVRDVKTSVDGQNVTFRVAITVKGS